MIRSLKTLFVLATLLCTSLFTAVSWADELPVIRLGALSFGTVNWELDTIKNNKLDEKHGFKLEVEALISKDISYVTEEYVPQRLADRDFLD